MNTPHNLVHVDLGARSYDIYIGAGLLDIAPNYVPLDLQGRKLFVLHDKAVDAHVKKLVASLPSQPSVLSLEGGEKTKSYEALQTVLSWLLDAHVDRSSVLFVVGGGVIGDLGGFAASIVLRGIPFVQVPTTLLSQVDSSVGGKTGVNTSQGKNLVGSFYQPCAVLCDTDTLNTLPQRELKAGYAEIAKYGLLGDAAFFEWLEENASAVLSLEHKAIVHAIQKSCQMKAEIVGTDERETAGGRRALLNLGHTFAHALEAAAAFDGRLLHGEAVSIGLVLAHRLSAKMDLCPLADCARLEKHLKQNGLMSEISDISPRLTQSAHDLVSLMYHDKKASGGKIGFILSRGIGDSFQSSHVNMTDVQAVISHSQG
jgi:3-dehydroquinate synthase